jgi:hypothetical protein
MWTRPQAPGFYLWDGVNPSLSAPSLPSPQGGEVNFLGQVQVVDSRVPEQLGAPASQQGYRRLA